MLMGTADIGEIDLLDFTKVWRAGYMRRTREIAEGAPGPTNVDVLHRELLDELMLREEYSPLAAAWDDKTRGELVQFWHKLDGQFSSYITPSCRKCADVRQHGRMISRLVRIVRGN